MEGDSIVKARQLFMDQRQKLIMKNAAKWQLDLLSRIMEKFVNELTTSGGVITNNGDNVKLVNAIDVIFNKFEKALTKDMIEKVVDDIENLTTLNGKYYSLYESNERQFEALNKSVRKSIRQKLGYDDKGNIKKNSYLDNYSNDKTVRLELRKMAYKYVTGGRKMKDLIKAIQTKVVGSDNTPGIVENHTKTFAYDLYAQYDRTINNEFATRLDLKHFVYAGGLIEGSREFCRKRNNKVFTTEDANEWKNDKTLPRTAAEKENGEITDYNPLIDMGRWNCRHIARYISKEQAQRLSK